MGYLENQTTSNPSSSTELRVDNEVPTNLDTDNLKNYDSGEFKISVNAGDDEIGAGTFSVVLRCRHPSLGIVVVKCFRLTGGSYGIERRLDEAVEEAKKLCIVTNSYIVKVYGITSWRNHFGIVMEEITGGNLEDLLFNPKISEIKWLLRLKLSVQIMKALEYLHTANRTGDGNSTKPKMQHCDLKPQNILLTDSADVKLCDFSAAVIARATVSTSSCSSACVRQYTPNYAAPEILKYQKVCSNSDIYSFGAILFEIITRTTVFNGISPNYIELAKISQDVDPNVEVLDNAEALLSGRDLQIFLGLRKIMKKCWETDPKERPSATQVLQELQNLIETLNIRSNDLEFVDIPREFKQITETRKSRSKHSNNAQKRLTQVNLLGMESSKDKVKDEEADSKDGDILALKKGKLLKYNIKSKKISILQGESELNGVLLKQGDKIYVVDVKSESQTIQLLKLENDQYTCEILNVRSGEKRSNAAVVICKNSVYVVGGLLNNNWCESGECFDLDKRVWSHIPAMHLKRQGHVLIASQDMILYVMGGYELNSVESLDLIENEGWTEIQPMTIERSGSAAVEITGKIYVLGGYDNRNNKVHSSVAIFDLQSNTWEQGSCLTTTRCWHDACVIGRRIYVVGGETNIVESFDPARDSQWEVEIKDPAFQGVRSIVAL